MAGAVGFPLAVFEVRPPSSRSSNVSASRTCRVRRPCSRHSSTILVGTSSTCRASRHAIVGAATIPAVLVRRMRDELGISSILSAYGLTENHTLGTFTAPDDPPDVVATTVGRPVPASNCEWSTTTETTWRVGGRKLVIRGPFLFSGYFDDEEATARASSTAGSTPATSGSSTTRGYLHVTDRKKDMFIVGGFNVAPAEVEKFIGAMEGVAAGGCCRDARRLHRGGRRRVRGAP